MKVNLKYPVLLFCAALFLFACKNNKNADNNKKILKGLYVFGPEMKSFTDCKGNTDYWVADSAKTLELSYSKFNFEKPYEPVYVEFECNVVPSDTTRAADFDSTVVVTKLIKISKKIPEGPCSQ